jgi:hypothetical protein
VLGRKTTARGNAGNGERVKCDMDIKYIPRLWVSREARKEYSQGLVPDSIAKTASNQNRGDIENMKQSK